MSDVKLKPALSEEILMGCMRCGFCLPACPTYRLTELESASPRGRIALMRAVHEGNLEIEEIAGNLDLCLGCRACEPVCPAGVTYGHLLEQGRAMLTEARPNPWPVRFAYKWVLGTPAGIRLAGVGLWFYQRSGLRWLARKLGVVARVGGPGLAAMEAAVGDVPAPWQRSAARRGAPVRSKAKRRVAFFTGCMSDIVFAETNRNALTVLAAAGCAVTVVPGQGCCGAVHAHAGEHGMALDQAKRNIAAFEQGEFDWIVNTAGGCGAALKEYGHLLKDDPAWADRAARFSRACRDFAEVVADVGLPALGQVAGTFTYQDSCHLRNAQRVTAQPRALLRAVPGARYVELPEADQCCGAAGTYAATQADASDRILSRKMQHVVATGADTVVVVNPPCHMEMVEGIQRAGLAEKIRVRHLADILAEAVAAADRAR
jgi:glycolate oxidase iron-sulfur subunit